MASLFDVLREVHPPENNQAQPVPPEMRQAVPFQSIVKITSFRSDGRALSEGTGWYWSGGLVVTAAHVVWGATSAIGIFSSGAECSFRGTDDIHPAYVESGGQLKGSPFDLAVLRIAYGDPPSGLVVSENIDPGSVVVVGYPRQSTTPVFHAAQAKNKLRYLIYGSHTVAGQSGAPVLDGNDVVAIHLGDAAWSQKWQPEAQVSFDSFWNTGPFFQAEQLNFLNNRAQNGELMS